VQDVEEHREVVLGKVFYRHRCAPRPCTVAIGRGAVKCDVRRGW
jgi:hypothetical protein